MAINDRYQKEKLVKLVSDSRTAGSRRTSLLTTVLIVPIRPRSETHGGHFRGSRGNQNRGSGVPQICL